MEARVIKIKGYEMWIGSPVVKNNGNGLNVPNYVRNIGLAACFINEKELNGAFELLPLKMEALEIVNV